jgi:surface antigen
MRVGLLSAAAVVGLVPLGGGIADAANQAPSSQGPATVTSNPADQTTKTFSDAGTYTLDLPAGVHGIIVNANGGYGGFGDANSQHQGGDGGAGTNVSAVVPVPNGVTKLTVIVGGHGMSGRGDQSGGFNGGGNGGHGGGGGGGASEVRAPDGSRLVVAGGGGGGGSYGSNEGGAGGNYGHSGGGDGDSGALECHGRGGGGGTTTSGGSPGKGPCIAPNGDGGGWVVGGDGGGNFATKGGGGGGGGYYGGGGGGAGSFGSGAGGGAGSSYVVPVGTYVSMTTASYGVSGVAITYPAPEVPEVTCPSPMPGAMVGHTFAVGCRVTGAPTPGVTLSEGSLPPGMSLVAPTPVSTGDNFSIRGVPTAAGSYPFNLTFTSAPGYDRTVSLTIVVSKAPVRVALGASPPKGGQGQTFVFTATVTPQADVAIAERPSGLVTFLDGDKTIGVDLVNEHGDKSQAILRVTDLSQGNHRIQAVYAGASNFEGGSDALTYPVDKTPTSITLFSSANPVDYGTSLSYVASVSSDGVGVPTGNLYVVADGSAVEQFDGTLVDGHLQGSFPQPLGLGHHSVVATYQGADTFQPSRRVLDQVVNGTGVATTTSVTASTKASQFYDPVTFTATVSSTGGSGSPTGVVRFESPQRLDQIAPVINGTATLTWRSLDVGFHDVTATYAPSGGTFIASMGKLAGGLSVNQAATTTTVTSTENPSLPGQAVTFYAHVASKWGVVDEGRVNLIIHGYVYDWCSGVLNGGIAAFPPDCYQASMLGPGPHIVTAKYVPYFRYLDSSDSVEQVVRTDPLPTVTSVRSSDRTSQFRQPVTFTASVTSMGKAIPTGDVQFAVDDVAVGGPVALSNGMATSQSIADLALGTHKVSASYAGSTALLLDPSEGSLADGQLVTTAPSTITISPSVNPYIKGVTNPPIYTVHVTSNGGYATGQVNFSLGTTEYHGELRAGWITFGGLSSVVEALPVGDTAVNVQYLSDSPAFANSSAHTALGVL